jgi:hypothetical protein
MFFVTARIGMALILPAMVFDAAQSGRKKFPMMCGEETR